MVKGRTSLLACCLAILFPAVSASVILFDSAQISVQVSDGNDDAEEYKSSGNMYLDSSDLEMVTDGGSEFLVGLRFRDIDVPKDATVTSAYIEFVTDETDSVSTNLAIRGQASDNAAAFSWDNSDISDRPLTSDAVNWNNVPAWNQVDETHQTPDLSVIVQDIVNRSGWSSGNAMAFVISGSGKRVAKSFDKGSGQDAALLFLEYTIEQQPSAGACCGSSGSCSVVESSSCNGSFQGSGTSCSPGICQTGATQISVRIDQQNDDAEEYSNGNMYLDSSDLEMVTEGTSELLVGLRFRGITVPNDATITSSYIEFVTDETDSDSTNLAIRGQASDNAAAFSWDNSDISARPLISDAVNWNNVPAWNQVDETHQTPDLSVIVQDIVNRSGWSSGNAMAFVISGTGTRVAKSFDNGSGQDAALLVVEYTTGEQPSTGACCDGSGSCSVTDVTTCSGSFQGSGTSCSPGVCPTPSAPTRSPTSLPTRGPTSGPTSEPTASPTQGPTSSPTSEPTASPTRDPTSSPTSEPVASSTPAPTPVPASGTTEISVRVNDRNDDAEEYQSSGNMYLDSSDLEMITDGANDFLVGLRFRDITVPKDATVTSAYIEFITDETDSVSTNLAIRGEASDNAAAFSWDNSDISDRPLTSDNVNWNNVPAWNQLDEAHQTPDLSAIVQDIVSRSGWSSGNAMAFVISGSGKRVAKSFDNGSGEDAALLVVEYASTPVPSLPTPAPMAPPPPPPAPTGPYVSPGYSERVAIPQPPQPSFLEGSDRTGCPHTESGPVNWNSLDLTPGSPGTPVTIPTNTRVLVTESIPVRMGLVTIPATSELILGENTASIDMEMDGMLVEGKLTAGSETCRLETPVTLTLYGSRPGDAVQNPPEPEVKGISVRGGTISLHGKRYYRTWTRLAQTVEAGSRLLYLQDQVNWEAGQKIVLVTTAMKDSREWHQNEELTIETVGSGPSGTTTIKVIQPVQYRHAANNNYQAEVGLLTRMIKIQGSASDSEPTDPDPLNCSDDRWKYGDYAAPCANTELTGYGAHVMVHQGGVGYVEGVELFRMGQTNVLGRYPMHFHLLGDCPECYLKDSSIHRSFYRCVSVHGTDWTTISENVGYDVSGYCYYLEDGIEKKNTMSFNLAAHIHTINKPAYGSGQTTDIFEQSNSLTLPADVTASGFYITNVENNIIGNSASGGWSGFAFPNLRTALGPFKDLVFRPSSAKALTIDGNTAHSTGWWWNHAGAFYFGGSLYYENNVLKYNPGRSFNFQEDGRNTCAEDFCAEGDCNGYCEPQDQEWIRVTNSKAFLSAGPGLNSWTGRMEIVGFESHDTSLSLEALESGFWIDNLLSVCRTGEPIALPDAARADRIRGNGFFWYDTGQEHIITDSTFRNCGYRSAEYDQYDSSPTRGCGDEADRGCHYRSTVFGFLTHSDTFNPEVMQGTSGIEFEDCGRRFYLSDFNGPDAPSTISGRLQNWLDVDGTASGLSEPTLIGSGQAAAGKWWDVDDRVVSDPQGPLKFIRKNDGPERAVGHVRFEWDEALHDQVDETVCGNGNGLPCPTLGTIRHVGPRFRDQPALPMKAQGDIAGLAGGFGWLLQLDGGAPKRMRFELIEVEPDTPLMFSVAYPQGTSFVITANARWCWANSDYSCSEEFQAVASVQDVRASLGNTYHVSSDGVLTFRIIQTAKLFTGTPNFILPGWDDPDRSGRWYALDRFERKNVRLPRLAYGPSLEVVADCSGSVYCSNGPSNSQPTSVDQVCPQGFEQTSYDRCCDPNNSSDCVFANGQVL